jgi:vacuolar-type H+-ATPase subunit D/Vma8
MKHTIKLINNYKEILEKNYSDEPELLDKYLKQYKSLENIEVEVDSKNIFGVFNELFEINGYEKQVFCTDYFKLLKSK